MILCWSIIQSIIQKKGELCIGHNNVKIFKKIKDKANETVRGLLDNAGFSECLVT